MSSITLPFLYQTRTLQRALRIPLAATSIRWAHSSHRRKPRTQDNSIPFEWDNESHSEELQDVPGKQSTITPSEAEVFKGIFDEIAQGKMPTARKRSLASDSITQNPVDLTESDGPGGLLGSRSSEQSQMARSIVEQARVTDFREKFLRRYPQSLRNAAQVALGLYELEPTGSGESQMLELEEADEEKWKERAKYDRIRTAERERIDGLMEKCATDAALWKVMQDEVFSLPEKLSIVQTTDNTKQRKPRSKRAAKTPRESMQPGLTEGSVTGRDDGHDAKQVMDVHGPLYSHFISTGLALFDTAFKHTSPFAFRILPRVKELGLPSYVLGVSTPFYARLAWIHWNRYGDANCALDVLQEMNSAGLYADESVHELIATIRDHLHGCTWGAQGPFVMSMMESPPYDSALTQRLDEMEQHALGSLAEQTRA